MKKGQLIEALMTKTNASKAEATRTLEAVLEIITKSIAKKEDVTITGFGTFKAVKRAARKGINPKTGEKLKIAAATVPRFSAGATLKAAVAGKAAAKKAAPAKAAPAKKAAVKAAPAKKAVAAKKAK